MARKKTSGKAQKSKSTPKSTKKVISSKQKQVPQNKKPASNLNRLKQSPVESKQKLGKGIGLQRWNYVRTQIKTMLNEKNIYPTKKELLAYSSEIYADVKDDFKNKSRAFDLVMDDYFYKAKEGTLASFPWWELGNNLYNLSPKDLIVVDNENVELGSVEATVADFRARHQSQMVNAMNGKFQRENGVYFIYLQYQKEVNGVEINYFMLINEEDSLSDLNSDEFEEHLKSQGIDLDSIASRMEYKIERTNIDEGETPKRKIKPEILPPLKRVGKKVAELKKTPPAPKGKQSINAAKEVAKMKKKRQHTVLIRELEKGGLNAKQILAVIKKIK